MARPRKGLTIDEADPRQMKKIGMIAKIGAELFSSRGYLETSMDDIAAAAKVTKGGIYHYFGSKTDILYYICSKYVEFDIENLEQSLSVIQNPLEKIKFIISRHINHYSVHAAAAKTLLNEAYNLPPRYRKEVKAREAQYVNIMTRTLSEYLGPDARKEVITTLVFTLFGMMNWIYSWYDPKGAMKPAELSGLIYDVFTKGITDPSFTAGGFGSIITRPVP